MNKNITYHDELTNEHLEQITGFINGTGFSLLKNYLEKKCAAKDRLSNITENIFDNGVYKGKVEGMKYLLNEITMIQDKCKNMEKED